LDWDGSAFRLTNKTNRTWTNVELEINKYFTTSGEIADGYKMTVKRIEAGSRVTLNARQFVKDDGLIFNLTTHRPTKFFVLCDVEGSDKKGFWIGTLG